MKVKEGGRIVEVIDAPYFKRGKPHGVGDGQQLAIHGHDRLLVSVLLPVPQTYVELKQGRTAVNDLMGRLDQHPRHHSGSAFANVPIPLHPPDASSRSFLRPSRKSCGMRCGLATYTSPARGRTIKTTHCAGVPTSKAAW